jgi:ribosome-binding ATPase YchF (GTP1/OBG family)
MLIGAVQFSVAVESFAFKFVANCVSYTSLFDSFSCVYLQALIPLAYDTLGLQTYFTSGPTETRAWTIVKVCSAPQVG